MPAEGRTDGEREKCIQKNKTNDNINDLRLIYNFSHEEESDDGLCAWLTKLFTTHKVHKAQGTKSLPLTRYTRFKVQDTRFKVQGCFVLSSLFNCCSMLQKQLFDISLCNTRCSLNIVFFNRF